MQPKRKKGDDDNKDEEEEEEEKTRSTKIYQFCWHTISAKKREEKKRRRIYSFTHQNLFVLLKDIFPKTRNDLISLFSINRNILILKQKILTFPFNQAECVMFTSWQILNYLRGWEVVFMQKIDECLLLLYCGNRKQEKNLRTGVEELTEHKKKTRD